jgi:hypothetical protein
MKPLSPRVPQPMIPDVLTPESQIQSSPAERALVLSIRMFRVVGGLLLAFFLVESLASLADLRLRNPTTELRFASQMTDRIPLGLLGLGLLLCHPRFLRLKSEAWLLKILATLPIVLTLFYLILIPLTMNAAANLFRNAAANLGLQAEEQVKKVRAVRDTTMNLSPEQQEGMVERYNRANPKKKPVDLQGFLKTLTDEVKGAEARLEQERRAVLGSQQRNLYASQFVQSLKCLLGAVAFFLIWKVSDWARTPGQLALGTELGAGRHRRNS